LPKTDEYGPTRLLCLACPRGNTVFLTGHETPTGYVTLRPGRVERLVYGRQRVSEPEVDPAVTLGRRQTLLDLLGIGYVIVREPATDYLDAGQLQRSLVQVRTADGLAILENRTSLPRSFFTTQVVDVRGGDDAWERITAPGFDPRGGVVLEGRSEASVARTRVAAFAPAHVTRYQQDQVEIVVEAPTPGFVVLLDRWAVGWQCSVNGQAAPILRANYLFQAVSVEAGPNVVRFEFRDQPLARGAGISALALGGCLGLLLTAALRRRRWIPRLGRPPT
jgi:hypothetical protein